MKYSQYIIYSWSYKPSNCILNLVVDNEIVVSSHSRNFGSQISVEGIGVVWIAISLVS